MTTSPALPDRPRETSFVEMVFPEQANHYGTLFGGSALSLMGKAAFVAASRYARAAIVMSRTDKVRFHKPVPVGDMIEITARVARVGHSSMTVTVDMVAETLVSGQRTLAVSGSFEMVAVDGSGRPVPIDLPPHLQTEKEIPS